MVGSLKSTAITLIVLLIVGYFVARELGLTKSKEQRKREEKEEEQDEEFNDIIKDNIITITKAETELRNNRYFDPLIWKNATSGDELISFGQADEKGRILKKALHGWFGDDEAMVYGVFRSLTNPYQISQIAAAYNRQTGGDLLAKILDDFDKGELAELNQIIKSI